MINTENKQTFTIAEFNQQIGEFRKLMGDKTFMESPEDKQTTAIDALTFVYLNTQTNTPNEKEQVEITFTMTIDEYNRRKNMLLLLPLRKALGLTKKS